MAIGQNFYGDSGLTDIEDLSRRQGKQSLLYGDQAARYADPFMGERGKYQKQLSDLMADPGGFASSPVYKFAYDQGLEALNRKGSLRSGNKLAELERYGQGMAGQQYFNQAKLLSELAMSGSSPATAGAAYERGTSRSQDQMQLSAAARSLGNGGIGANSAASNEKPWWWGGTGGNNSTLPTGGASGGYGGGYGSTSGYSGYGGGDGYTPTGGAGTGYMTSDYGTTNFGNLYDPTGYGVGFDYNDPWGGGYYTGEE